MLLKSTLNIPLSDPNHPVWFYHDNGNKEWICRYLTVSEQNIIQGQYDSLKRFENESIYDITALYSLLGDEDITLSILSKIAEGNHKILYVPFYEYQLLQYVMSISWELKLQRPENILRKSLAHQCNIPNFIINRQKSGFGVISNQWSTRSGIFEPFISIASKVFDEKEIRKMQSLEPKTAMMFWNILNYSIWKRLCINNESLDDLLGELNISI
jgi:hypothetical protein